MTAKGLATKLLIFNLIMAALFILVNHYILTLLNSSDIWYYWFFGFSGSPKGVSYVYFYLNFPLIIYLFTFLVDIYGLFKIRKSKD
jgi:hypothetical protein